VLHQRELRIQSLHREHQIQRSPVLLQLQYKLLLVLARLRVSQRKLDPIAKVLQKAERATSGFDIPHRFVQTGLYDMPFFKGSSGFTKLVLDGWQVSTIITAQSGYGAPSTSASIPPARA
jgi:hypothetical protein